jgi:NAD+ synthase (glutamine-hydrolysing)
MKNNSRFGFVRVAIARPEAKIGNCTFNAQSHLAEMKNAQQKGADFLLFPELSITTYSPGVLFQQEVLQQAALDALEKIRVDGAKLFSGVVIVGCPIFLDNGLYNCAVVLQQGRCLGVVPKSFLPNYKEFTEKRWFAESSTARSTEVMLAETMVPFGTDLLFRCDVKISAFAPDGTRSKEWRRKLAFCIDICEDIFNPIPPSTMMYLMGALMGFNLSASNELIGKVDYRRSLVVGQSAKCIGVYAYACAGPLDETSTDTVLSGHCMIAENGSMIAESERFGDGDRLLIADVDIDRLINDRMRTNSFNDTLRHYGLRPSCREVLFELDPVFAPLRDNFDSKMMRYIDAHPFVPSNPETLRARCEEIFNIQVAGLSKRLKHLNFPNVTIGVSGGLDSTHALSVLCKVYDKAGEPRSKIQAYTMPGFGTTKRTKGNAHKLMKALGVTIHEVDIRKMCLLEMQAVGHKPFGIDLTGHTVASLSKAFLTLPDDAQDVIFENVQARMRTLILMNAGFVIGTGDLSELALGWCTFNADHMSMYNPNCSIPKTLVKFLVKWTAENQFTEKSEAIVKATMLDIFATEISPELLPPSADGQIKQKTEDKVGPYELHDFTLYHFCRFGASPAKIVFLAKQAKFDVAYDEATIRKWLMVFVRRFFSQQFKRSTLPDGPKVGSISLSPRAEWLMPSDADPTIWLEWLEAQTLAGC